MIYKTDVKCFNFFFISSEMPSITVFYRYFLLLFREKTAYQMGSSCYTFGVFQNFIPISA